jgi:hypothetical protein
VQEALGVAKATVWRWINDGWLQAMQAPCHKRRMYTTSHDDVTAFLFQRGALFPLSPSNTWQPIVDEARIALGHRLIAGADVARVLCVARRTMHGYQGSFRDFPPPYLSWPRIGGSWFERAAVRAWLERHPEYQSKRTLEGI